MKKKYELKEINDFTCNLKINKNSAPIYKLIKKMIKSCFYDEETNSLFFSVESFKTLNTYLLEKKTISHGKCIKMIDDLTKQLLYLKSLNYGFYGFDIDDIIVIDDNLFIFCSGEYLIPLTNNIITFYAPIKQPYFGSPELITLTMLPSKINYKTSYYSLGVLVVYCLFNKYLLVGNEIKSEEEIDIILDPIHNTKLYWFLKRCLTMESDKRTLLLI